MTIPLCSLARARDALKATSTSTTDDDALMARVLFASTRINKIMGIRDYFVPALDTEYLMVTEDMVNSYARSIHFRRPLLALTAVTHNGAAMTVNTNVKMFPVGVYPAYRLHMVDSSDWYSWSGINTVDYPIPLVTITGTWGYSERYATAWELVSTLNGAISSNTIATLTSASTVTDIVYDDQRISRGHLIKIDDEIMEVTTATGTTVTMRRGAQGTTAVTHLTGSSIYRWRVEPDVSAAVARQAAAMYSRRGAFENVTITDIGTTQYPPDLLHEIYGVLQAYAYN